MGRRFVKTHEADRRAIELYLQLRAIEQLPHVVVRIGNDRKKIIIAEKSDLMQFNDASVDVVLSFDVDAASANGGTREALLVSRHKKPATIPPTELQEAVDDFLKGEDTEH